MSNEFITKEFTKIIEDKSFETPLNLAMGAAWIMGNFKGINLKILDLREIASISDFFIIGSAGNPTQARAMAEEIANQMRKAGKEAISREGLKHSTDWILLDYGDLIVHVFTESARAIYDLDHLYAKAVTVQIPNDYYIAGPSDMYPVSNDKDYF